MPQVNVKLPDRLYDEVKALVEDDQFQSKSAAIRYAVRTMLQRERHGE